MKKFIPKEKLGKKARKQLDNEQRTTWAFSPVTTVSPPGAACTAQAAPGNREAFAMKQTQSQLIKGLPRRIALMLLDCGLIALCYYLAVLLRFDGNDAIKRPAVFAALVEYLPYILAVYMLVYWFGGLYEILWEYAGLRDLARLMLLSGLATGISMILNMFYRGWQSGGQPWQFGFAELGNPIGFPTFARSRSRP